MLFKEALKAASLRTSPWPSRVKMRGLERVLISALASWSSGAPKRSDKASSGAPHRATHGDWPNACQLTAQRNSCQSGRAEQVKRCGESRVSPDIRWETESEGGRESEREREFGMWLEHILRFIASASWRAVPATTS